MYPSQQHATADFHAAACHPLSSCRRPLCLKGRREAAALQLLRSGNAASARLLEWRQSPSTQQMKQVHFPAVFQLPVNITTDMRHPWTALTGCHDCVAVSFGGTLMAFLERSAAASDANDAGASADMDEGTGLAANSTAKRTARELRALCGAVSRARTSEARKPAWIPALEILAALTQGSTECHPSYLCCSWCIKQVICSLQNKPFDQGDGLLQHSLRHTHHLLDRRRCSGRQWGSCGSCWQP